MHYSRLKCPEGYTKINGNKPNLSSSYRIAGKFRGMYILRSSHKPQIPSSKFSRTKFLLMIDHPRKLHTVKNSRYTVTIIIIIKCICDHVSKGGSLELKEESSSGLSGGVQGNTNMTADL